MKSQFKIVFLAVVVTAQAPILASVSKPSVRFAPCKSHRNPSLDEAMSGFLRAIRTKNTKLFLSYIYPAKGLLLVNTLWGYNDRRQTFIYSYHSLEKDSSAKKGLYGNFFTVAEEGGDTFFDDAIHIKGNKWKEVNSNTFIPAAKNEPLLRLKWEKIREQWFLVELGDPEA